MEKIKILKNPPQQLKKKSLLYSDWQHGYFRIKKKKNQYSKNTEKINPSSFPLQSTFNCESKAETFWSSRCGPGEMNWTSIHGDAGSIASLAQWVKYSALP